MAKAKLSQTTGLFELDVPKQKFEGGEKVP